MEDKKKKKEDKKKKETSQKVPSKIIFTHLVCFVEDFLTLCYFVLKPIQSYHDSIYKLFYQFIISSSSCLTDCSSCFRCQNRKSKVCFSLDTYSLTLSLSLSLVL